MHARVYGLDVLIQREGLEVQLQVQFIHSADVGGWSVSMSVLYNSLIVSWGRRAECAGK